MTDVVDTFCGIGWAFACEGLGVAEHGIDLEPTVADTRTKLGWDTTTADILDLEPTDYAGADGLVASPPCQSWSRAGKGAGLNDPRGLLVWQPLVWALAIRPTSGTCHGTAREKGTEVNVAYDLDDAGFQPYWIAYAAAHQRTPQEQFDFDRDAHGTFPGQRLMEWIDGQWADFGQPAGHRGGRDHAGFARWLAEKWGTA